MTYIEAINVINEIERRYDVMSIKFKGISIWPLLRLNLVDCMTTRNQTTGITFVSAVKQVLNTLFYYNPLSYFKKSRTWLFTAFDRRKDLNERMIQRVSGAVIEVEPNILIIEKPSPLQFSIPRKTIPEKRIVSESWILLLVHFFSFVTKWHKRKIVNSDLLNKILADYKLNFNYQNSVRILSSQRRVLSLILLITSKPEKVVIECPYTVMGYLWALHSHHIPIIELQHGVLNECHYAYNSLYHSKELYPDKLCVFGEYEYNFMTGENGHYCKDVRKTGLYYLELANRSFVDDPFKDFRSQYKNMILISGQKGYEEQMAEYVNKIASMEKASLFIYVPRTLDIKLNLNQTNTIFCPGINIYEYMKWCDVHCTISSTTCLECQYFHKPTIFFDLDNLASKYYGKMLTSENGVIYTKRPEEFSSALVWVLHTEFEYKRVFENNTIKEIKKIING